MEKRYLIYPYLSVNRDNSKKQKIPSLSFILLYLLSLLLLAGCTAIDQQGDLSGKIRILESRIVVLEKQKQKSVLDLSSESDRFKQEVSTEIANFRKSLRFFISELDQIKDDINMLTNDLEKSQHTARVLKLNMRRLSKKVGDLVIAIDQVQQFFDERIEIDSVNSVKQQEEFKKSYQLFKKKQFISAEEGFFKFIEKYPTSNLADDSMFLIAYIYFLSGNYKKASIRFFEMIRQYPKSNRLNDAKWWLGVSLERSGDVIGAKDLYKDLLKLSAENPFQQKAKLRLEELIGD